MKKVFLFLSIIMFAFTGVLFACNEDRYADLKIQVSSVVYTDTGIAANYNEEQDYYEIMYGQNFSITATTSCSNDISHAVLFDSLSSMSVNYISKQDTQNGSKGIFKAAAPSYNGFFKINIRSVETNRNSTSVFIKVILPVASVSLQDNLGLTYGHNINLKGYVLYTSVVANSNLMPTEKGVAFTLKSFQPIGETNTLKLVEVEKVNDANIIYGLDDGQNVPLFKVTNGVIETLNSYVEGTIVVETVSTKYSSKKEEDYQLAVDNGEILTEEQIKDREANNKLKDETLISVVKGIGIEDIAFMGGQVGFDNSNAQSKLNASLYINSSATYQANGKTHRYHAEQLDLSISTKANISVKAEIGSIIDNEGNEILSDGNIILIENGDDLILNPTQSDGIVTGQTSVVKIVTAGGCGNAYVDFVITFSDFLNIIPYRFSELYKQSEIYQNYIENLTQEEKEISAADKSGKIKISTSVLPGDISVLQDGEKINTDNGSAIKIYDTYNSQNNNVSVNGTKLYPILTLASGLTSVKIDDLNKIVRVFISYVEDVNVNVAEYLEIRDFDAKRIPLTQDGANGYYFDLDLTKENSSYFYVKAVKGKLVNNAEFNFKFENQLKTTITDVNGKPITPNDTQTTTLTNKSVLFKAKTIKGVEEIVALINGGAQYYTVSGKDLDPNPLYQQVVLKSNSGNVYEELGTIVGIVLNAGVDIDEKLNIFVEDEEIAKVYTDVLDALEIFEDWDGYRKSGLDSQGNPTETTVMQFSQGVSVVGKKAGKTTLYIQSQNGYMTTVAIEVVNQINNASDNFTLEIKQNIANKVVTEDKLSEEKPYVSAKIDRNPGADFNIVYSIKPDTTSVVDVKYFVYKKGTWGVDGVSPELSNILVINQDIGAVTLSSLGQATIVVEMTYYKFDYVDGLHAWSSDTYSKSFDITVYEPAKSIGLNRYKFEENEIYDRNSLGYKYIKNSLVVITPIITPDTATIASDPSAVKYSLPAGNKNLVGSNGVYTAYLLEGQTRAEVDVTVSITEFGYTVDLVCHVVITRAPQIESIDYAAIDGDEKIAKEKTAWNDNYDYISTKNNKTLRLDTKIYSKSNILFEDNLVVTLFKVEDPTVTTPMLSTNTFNDADDHFAELLYAGKQGQSIVLQSGVDTFQLKIDETLTGTFFIVIFAEDSMTSEVTGKVTKIICVNIESGTVENPFVISTFNQLLEINENPSAHYVLGANINIASIANWTPLATLTGSLNGYNANVAKFYTISGLKISRANGENVGLFTSIGKNAANHSVGAVLNLKLIVSYIRVFEVDSSLSQINLGAIAGTNEGVIYNCSVEAPIYEVSVDKIANIGGVVGVNKGGIYNVPIAYDSLNTQDAFSGGPDLSTLRYSSNGIISENLITADTTKVRSILDTDLNGLTHYEVLEKFCVSTNPVNVNMVVSDSPTGHVYVGGMVGHQNGGFINGIYGVYNDIEEKLISNAAAGSVNYLTAFQSQGVDVVANINTTSGEIVNSLSAIGGVVGCSVDGKVANVSVNGQIGRYNSLDNTTLGAKNNVGGIVGQASSSTTTNIVTAISNASASVKLRANDYVGGAVGDLSKAIISLVRVESYQGNSNNVDNQTLIIASNCAGGVVGIADRSKISLVYSYSFVDDFDTDYISLGDIYLISDNSTAGGVLGFAGDKDDSIPYSQNVEISQSYSTFNIVSDKENVKIAGISGNNDNTSGENSLLINDVFYIGVLTGGKDAVVNNFAPSEFVYSSGYNYYYVLNYELLSDDSYALVLSGNGVEGDLNSNYTADKINLFNYSEVVNGEISNIQTIQNNVLVYTSPSGNAKFNFIKTIPNAIDIEANDSGVVQIVDNALSLENYSTDKKYFYSYEVNDVLHIIALYNKLNNTFNLNNLFTVVSTPSIAGRLNILVDFNNTKVLSITNQGNLIVNGLGTAQLTFKVKENNSALASKIVIVDIVENFDKLLVTNSNLFHEDYDLIQNQEEISVRKNTALNFFSLFGKYVELTEEDNKIFSYGSYDSLSLIQIENVSGYNLKYVVYNKDGVTLADNSYYTISNTNKSILFKVADEFVVKFIVEFQIDGVTYFFTNPAWKVKVNVYEGVSYIKFNTEQIWLAGDETKKIDVIVTSDAEEFNINDLTLYLNTQENKFIYESGLNYKNGIDYITLDSIINLTYVDNSYKNVGTSHYFTFNVSISKNYRYQTQLTDFVLYVADAVNNSVSAQVEITIAPQGVNGIAGIHYAYTQTVSEVEANVNTGAAMENENYAYSFTNEPKDTVVAGSEGLFVIDLYPYYSDITSVTIHSSMGDRGDSLQFAQLVKIQSETTGSYYIYAPQTKATSNGGIELNLYSYVDPNQARLRYDSSTGVYTVIYNGVTDLTNSYIFDDKNSGYSDNSEIGRLYIKTIAPTSLSAEDSFTVYVTVKYKALNENFELVELEKTYEHKLVVESMPGFSLSVSHDGNERNIIAYTGEEETVDYLDIIPKVGEGYSYESISASLFKTSEDPDVKQGSNDTGSIILTDIDSGAGKRLMLGPKARVGDTIVVTIILSISFDGYIQTRLFTTQIKVVDVVIESIEVEGLDANNTLKLTVSTSKQLKAKINGFGTSTAISLAENQISRSISYENNSINYWYAKSANANEFYVNLDSVNIRNNLPFLINKVTISNDKTTVKVDNTAVGANKSQQEIEISTLPKLVVLEGSTASGTLEMLLRFSYVYLDNNYSENSYNVNKGQIVFVPNTFATSFIQEKYFTVVVTEDSNEDNPTPIYDEADLYKMASSTGGDYILMNDITITNHTALKAEFDSFDGNNKIITIQSFAYNPNLVSSNSTYSINMGLFDTVSAKTIIKNVIVALPADKKVAMDLTGYATINFGGIAAINNGVITNCDVISVTNAVNISLNRYLTAIATSSDDFINNYTLNIETSDIINGSDVKTQIGLLVGHNTSTGFVTNSRVGRESVDILSVQDSESTVVYKNAYAYTSPIMLVKIYGRANVGGFVSVNDGTISSSYTKNIQLEVISKSATNFVKTGGFVVMNNGFIHGSYVAGWEEDDLTLSEGYATSANRKLGGGIYSNGFIGGFVYRNGQFIEDSYSNINISGSLTFAAESDYIKFLKSNEKTKDWVSPAVGGFVYTSIAKSQITTSYSLSKITTKDTSSRSNTHGAFEGRMEAPDSEFDNSGEVTNSYFMQEKDEEFSYEHERAVKLTDDPAIDLGNDQSASGQNEFIVQGSFNNFSFDNSITDFSKYTGESMGGVWAIYKPDSVHGYPELISANTVAISSRVINTTKTNASEANKYYYTYVDGYDIGSTKNPYLVSSFKQFNNIFKDTVKADSNNFNQNVATKFTGNIRLVKHINFDNSEEVYSTSVEYTSLVDLTSIFDGNYLAMYNITLVDNSDGKTSFGLFKDIYYAAVKNITLAVDKVGAGNTTTVGALAGAIVNSNISNVTLVTSTNTTGVVTGNNYVGGLAGIVVSNDEENLFTISNVKSNLSIVGGVSTGSNVTAITTSKIVWERIKPTAVSSGLSELNANLRLHRLPVNVFYAGGVAGILDLHQLDDGTGKLELTTVNAYNIHVGELSINTNISSAEVSYNTNVSIISDYSGGLFGMIGIKTYLETSEFIVNNENANHFIEAKEIAGGIAAVNFGKISQTYVSFTNANTKALNTSVVEYLKQENLTANTHPNKTLFASGTPKYIGGIAGINVGNGDYGSGHIVDCYNRVDVRNPYAIGVGGIVGGSYIGQISNVYTTASLLGNLNNNNTKIGGIIGKIFYSEEDFDEGYFADYQDDNSGATDNLVLLNIVALNLWIEEDFDALYDFAKINSIGALYGEFENVARDQDGQDTFVKIDANSGIFVQNYVLKNFNDKDISLEDFNAEEHLDPETYFELWGTSENEHSPNFNKFLAQFFTVGESNESLITPNKYKALFSGTEYGVSSLRVTYFPSVKWSRAIWNYDDDKLLPVLEYGYETSVIRIYTAEQFKQELSSGTTAGKFYVIMNDIDFSGIEINPIIQTFRGHLYGNTVSYVEGTNRYTRKPILFNIRIDSKTDIEGNLKDEPNAKYAMFTDSVGAVFENFNIVLSNYNVEFSSTGDEKVASVLVANSVDTTMTNVHIYSSLNSFINEEILEGNYVIDETETAPFVTKGTYYDSSLNRLRFSSAAFLKVAALDNKVGKTVQEIENFQPIELYYELKADAPGGPAYIPLRYIDKNGNTHTKINGVDLVDEASPLSTKSVSIENVSVNIKNANYVGLLTGTSSLSYVAHSSVNLSNLNIVYDTMKNNTLTIYTGTLIGKNIGEVRNIAGTAKINISFGGNYDGFGGAYIGGLVGCHNGIVNRAFAKSLDINVGEAGNNGSSDSPIKGTTGNTGILIGGAFGAIDRYTTLNESVVGGTDYLHLTNCKITAYVFGVTKIGGAIGQNGFTISDVYNTQLTNRVYGAGGVSDSAINVVVYDESAEYLIGGVIGENNASIISNAFTNVSMNIKVKRSVDSNITILEGNYTLKVGGIFAHSGVEVEFENVVNDADFINIDNGTAASAENYKTGKLYVGGIAGHVQETSSRLHLYNALTTVDIKTTQEKELYVGGAVGRADGGMTISSGAVLGDIYLWRANKAPDGKLFFKEAHRIGGLVGYLPEEGVDFSQHNSNINNRDECNFVVLSTIRDYAVAQKVNLGVGPVVGSKVKDEYVRVTNLKYSESVALVSNNGYRTNKMQGINQTYIDGETFYSDYLLKTTIDAYKNILRDFEGASQFDVHNSEEVYSKCDSKFFNVITTNSNANEYEGFVGTKLYPQVYFNASYVENIQEGLTLTTSSANIESNKYYVLASNIKSTLVNITATGWVLNAQGCASSAYPAFETITEGSAVVGLLANSNDTKNNVGITTTNYGFIFACGVAGKIQMIAASSIANANYGVISTSFSIADLYASASAGGLVINNGSETYIGNIYSSYYTGSIMPTSSTGNFAGLALNPNNNNYGVISNSYTMADIDTTSSAATQGTSFGGSVYPITASTAANTYKTFYDFVAYTGNNEGLNQAQAEQQNYITISGIYVWSSTLTGDTRNPDINNEPLLEGNWLAPGKANDLKELYKTSSLYNSADGELEKLDASWLNFGYTTNNFVNILVGKENVTNYITMLYTGNGLASRESAANENTQTSTYGLLDKPYKVKHAGILDILVAGNNKEGTVNYKYYLFTKNINFIKYTGLTYWSKTWDDTGIVFAGDLDGYKDNNTNYKVLNMFSSYGLVRGMPTSGDEKITTIRNINLEQCYSKTGLVAGYTGDKTNIENVIIKDSIVYNGDISSLTNGIFSGKGYGFIAGDGNNADDEKYNAYVENNGYFAKQNFNKMPYRGDYLANTSDNFAGGLVGYMNGGSIQANCSLNNTYVLASDVIFDRDNDFAIPQVTDTYIGGLVGYMQSGTIGAQSDNDPNTDKEVWNFNNPLTVASVSSSSKTKSYVGGIAGYVTTAIGGNATIQNIKVTRVTINGSYAVGGIAGRLNNGNLINNTYANKSNINIQNSLIQNGRSGDYSITSKSLSDVQFVYTGGIVGVADSGNIQGCQVKDGNDININFYDILPKQGAIVALGGIAGQLNGATIKSNKTAKTLSINNNSFAQKIVGGIVGLMENGTITGTADDKTTVATGVAIGTNDNNISGGIVGKITNGTIANCISKASNITSSEIAGGIVGFAEVSHDNNTLVTIQNCISEGSNINGYYYAGGVVGKIITTSNLQGTKNNHGFNCTIYNCKNSSTVLTNNTITTITEELVNEEGVTAYTKLYGIAGGIAGYIAGEKNNNFYSVKIDGCQNSGKIKTSNKDSNLSMAGGVAGFTNCVMLSNSQNTGEISDGDNSSSYISAGIVAYAKNTNIAKVYSDGKIRAQSLVGGIVGLIEENSMLLDTIQTGINCDILAVGLGGVAGGIIGYGGSVLSTNFVRIDSTAKLKSNGIVHGYVAGGIIGYLSKLQINSAELINENTKVIADSQIGTPLSRNYAFENGLLTITEDESFYIRALPSSNTAGGIIGLVTQDIRFESLIVNKGEVYAQDGVAGGIFGQLLNGVVNVISAQNEGLVGAKTVVAGEPEIVSSIAGGIVGIANNNVNIGDKGELETPENLKVINSGSIYATTFAGGIAGDLIGGTIVGNSVSKIQNAGDVVSIYAGSNAGEGAAGGIAGRMYGGTIDSVTVTNLSSVTANNSNAGGVVGYMANGTIGQTTINESNQMINHLNNTIGGEIISSENNAGGVVGYLQGGHILYNKWAFYKNTIVTAKSAGGLVGYMQGGTIYGDVSGNPTQEEEVTITGTVNAGGLVGYMGTGSIINNYVVEVNKLDEEGNILLDEDEKPVKETLSFETHGGKINVSHRGNNVYGGGLVGNMAGGTIKGGTGGEVKVAETSTFASYAGGLVGYMESGTISGGTAKNNISAGNSAGGLVGYMFGTSEITNGSATEATVTDALNKGGMVGFLTGSAIIKGGSGCDVSGGDNAGGIVGLMENGTIKIASGGSAKNAKNAGGVVGKIIGGQIAGGFGGDVTGTNAGGVAGYSAGNASIKGGAGGSVYGSAYAGGVVGYMEAGEVNGGSAASVKGVSAGGLVGIIKGGGVVSGGNTTVTGTSNAGGIAGVAVGGIIACNPSGKVTAPTAGGVVGKVTEGSVTIATKEISCSTIEGSTNAGGIIGEILAGEVGLSNNIKIEKNCLSGNGKKGYIVHSIPQNATIGGASDITITLVPETNIPLTSENKGTLANISIEATIVDTESGAGTNFGAITKTNYGTIYNCKNKATISTSAMHIGGIAGMNKDTGVISSCENTKEIKYTGSIYCRVGGLVGINYGSVNGRNSGKIIASTNPKATDAITNRTSGTSTLFNNSATNASASEVVSYAGGIAGEVASGTVEGKNSGKIVNLISYTSTDSSANIIDYRGQIAGAKTDSSAIVKNLNGHTDFSGAPEIKVYGDPIYVVFSFFESGANELSDFDRSLHEHGNYSPSDSYSYYNRKVQSFSNTNWIDTYAVENTINKITTTTDTDIFPKQWYHTMESGLWDAVWKITALLDFYMGTKVTIRDDGYQILDTVNSKYQQVWGNNIKFASQTYEYNHTKVTTNQAGEFSAVVYPDESTWNSSGFNVIDNYVQGRLKNGTSGYHYPTDKYEIKAIKASGFRKAIGFAYGTADSSNYEISGIKAVNMVYEVKEYSYSDAEVQNVGGLQDCGGNVAQTTLSADNFESEGSENFYECKESYEIAALETLYKLCGEACYNSTGDGSLVPEPSVDLSKYACSVSPGSAGGSGSLTGSISGAHLDHAKKLDPTAPGYQLARTAIQIRQSVATHGNWQYRFLYRNGSSGNYNDRPPEGLYGNVYVNKKGSCYYDVKNSIRYEGAAADALTSEQKEKLVSYNIVNGNTNWCLGDVIRAINEGGDYWWCSDCWGFLEVCLDINGLSGCDEYKVINPSKESGVAMQAGDIIYTSTGAVISGEKENPHYLMYLYTDDMGTEDPDDDKLYFADQSNIRIGQYYKHGDNWIVLIGDYRIYDNFRKYA